MPRPVGSKNVPKFKLSNDDLNHLTKDELIKKLFNQVIDNAIIDREKALMVYKELIQKADEDDTDYMSRSTAKDYLKIAQTSNEQLIKIYSMNKGSVTDKGDEQDDIDFFEKIKQAKGISEADEDDEDE